MKHFSTERAIHSLSYFVNVRCPLMSLIFNLPFTIQIPNNLR